MPDRKCFCGAPVTHPRKSAVWCSNECRHRNRYLVNSGPGPRSAISYGDCQVCGRLFVVRGGKGSRLCDSPDCYRVWNAARARDKAARVGWAAVTPRRLVDRICAWCGAAYRGRQDEPAGKRFCSLACRTRHDAAKAVRVNGRKLSHRQRLRRVYRGPVDRWAVFERDGWVCGICGRPIDRQLAYPHPESVVIDHIVPIAGLIGTDEMSNVQAAHKRCNEIKSDKPLWRSPP